MWSYSLRAFHPITINSLVRTWQPPKYNRNAARRIQTRASHSSSPATPPAATPPPSNIPWLAAAATLVTASATLFAAQGANAAEASASASAAADQDGPITVEVLQGDSNVIQVLSKEALLAEELPLLDADHMFSAFVKAGILRDIDCYFNKKTQTFYSVISIGRQACGWPATVHGGLIASIVDESFGGLMMCLIRQRVISGWRPSYTVQLDVTYKQRMPHNRTIICSSSLEQAKDRKTWFKAAVIDAQNGSTYATAKALFVAPRLRKVVGDVVSAVKSRVGQFVFGKREDDE